MDEQTYLHLLELAAELDQLLADTQDALQHLARDLHSVPATHLVPPSRTWMISHLYEIQANLRGAENHIAALTSRMVVHHDQQAGGA